MRAIGIVLWLSLSMQLGHWSGVAGTLEGRRLYVAVTVGGLLFLAWALAPERR